MSGRRALQEQHAAQPTIWNVFQPCSNAGSFHSLVNTGASLSSCLRAGAVGWGRSSSVVSSEHRKTGTAWQCGEWTQYVSVDVFDVLDGRRMAPASVASPSTTRTP
jgi:hypothetical protein